MISIIVTAYVFDQELYELTLNCLNSLQGQAEEIILLDNGSTIKLDFDNLVTRVIRTEKNEGCVRFGNVGVKAAKGDFIVSASNDTQLIEGNLTDMVTEGLSFPLVEWSHPWNAPIAHAGFMGYPNDPFYLNDERFRTYFSDLDLFERAKQKGVPFTQIESVKIFHQRRATLSKTGERETQYYVDEAEFTKKWGWTPE